MMLVSSIKVISFEEVNCFSLDIDENVTGDDSTKNHRRSHNKPATISKNYLVMGGGIIAVTAAGYRPQSMMMVPP